MLILTLKHKKYRYLINLIVLLYSDKIRLTLRHWTILTRNVHVYHVRGHWYRITQLILYA